MKKKLTYRKELTFLKKNEKKKAEKHRRKLKSTMEWMDIENIDENGITLKRNSRTLTAKGIRLLPVNISLMQDQSIRKQISSLSAAFDKLYQYPLYFKFIKADPDVTLQAADYIKKQEGEQNPAVSRLMDLEIDKLEWFRSSHKEVLFFVMIREDEKHIDKAYDLLIREFASAWGTSMISKMTYSNYKAVVQQEFNNDTVDEYLFTQTLWKGE